MKPRILLNLPAALIFSALLPSPSFSGMEVSLCGEPPAKARLDALALPWQPQITSETLRGQIAALSAGNLKDLRAAVGPLSELEKKVGKQTGSMMPPYLIHRLTVERLRGVFEMGGIVSPREMQRRAGNNEKPFTPPLEDKLFGGYDCVFVTAGPPQGRPRYGEVLLSVKPKTDGSAWASHSSGWAFMGGVRKSTPTLEMPLSADDALAYSHLVLSDADWEQAYPLFIILHLRALGEKGPELAAQLLALKERENFWSFVDARRLGYFEGKYSAIIPLEDIEYIEVPPQAYEEVMSWPNTPKNKIRKRSCSK